MQEQVSEEVQAVHDKIRQQIAEHDILLYMKGSPKLPSCGFSAQASQALMSFVVKTEPVEWAI